MNYFYTFFKSLLVWSFIISGPSICSQDELELVPYQGPTTQETSTKQAQNYYDILGISPKATADEIKKAYRQESLKWHPDKNKSPEAESRFKEISEAYKTLVDNNSRILYDAELRRAERQAQSDKKAEKATLYTFFGVDKDASIDNIKIIYETKLRQYEDLKAKNPDKAAVVDQAIASLNKAYAVLNDPEKRKQYNDQLAGVKPAQPSAQQPATPAKQQSSAPEEEIKTIKSLYASLGLNRDASPAQIQAAYDSQLNAYNQLKEQNPSEAARIDEQINKLKTTYETLKDPVLRKAYDKDLAMQAMSGEKIDEKITIPKEVTDAELKRIAQGMADQIKTAGQINLNELKEINFQNIFINKLLSFIPQKDINIVKNLVIRTPTFTSAPWKDVLGGFALQGSIIYNGAQSDIKVVVARTKEGILGIALIIHLPEQWKISQDYPVLAKLDELSILSPQLIFSNVDFKDPQYGGIKKGLTFVSNLNLTGPVAQFDQVLKTWNSYLTAQGGTIFLKGVISPDIVNSSFFFEIPLKIGVNFNDLYARGKIKTPPTIFSSIMTGEWVVSITPKDLSTSVTAGIEIGLVTQKEPLRLNAIVKYIPPAGWVFAGETLGMWDPAFGQPWLALGNTALEVGIDPVVTAAAAAVGIPLPINNFGAQGTLALGQGAKRVQISLAGKVSISTPKPGEPLPIPTFVLYGSVNKIDLAAFVQLLSKMSGKFIQPNALPVIEFDNLSLKVAPTGGSIGSTIYPAGIVASGGMQIGSFKGGLDFAINNTNKTIAGSGYMSSINTPIFSITGESEGNNPRFSMHISPLKQDILIAGSFGIPFLGFKKGIEFQCNPLGLYSNVDNIEFFGTKMSSTIIHIPFDNFDNLLLSYEVNSSTIQQIKEGINNILRAWEDDVTQSFKSLRSDIASRKQNREKTLRSLYAERNQLKKECEAAGLLDKVGVCTKYAAKEAEIQFNEASKDILSWSSELSRSAEKVPKGLLDAAGNIIDVATAFEITKISGQLTGADLKAGKMARVTIEVTVNVFGKKQVHTMKDMQFDFANPLRSIKSIAIEIEKFFS